MTKQVLWLAIRASLVLLAQIQSAFGFVAPSFLHIPCPSLVQRSAASHSSHFFLRNAILTRREALPSDDDDDDDTAADKEGNNDNDDDDNDKSLENPLSTQFGRSSPDKSVNPYADPEYPDLEFVDYSDPDYQIDMGLDGDELYSNDATATSDVETDLETLEAMREDRRRRNDEFQFQTFFANIMKQGTEYKGEWTVYKTSTFLSGSGTDDDDEEEDEPPRLIKAAQPVKVVSQGSKIVLDDAAAGGDVKFPVDKERIVQSERIATQQEVAASFSGAPQSAEEEEDEELSPQAAMVQKELLSKLYSPENLSAADFRGKQGIMCVSNAYTLATAVPYHHHHHHNGAVVPTTTTTTHDTDGPFCEYRTEVGLTTEQLRFRIKLDYAIIVEPKEEAAKPAASPPPPLFLRSLVVCREMSQEWPRSTEFDVAARLSNSKDDDDDDAETDDRSSSNSNVMASINEALFGIPGADNGLYDPPPVPEDVASQYLQLDLDGHATALFPYKMDQRQEEQEGRGWVVSLDWTPGQMRYQVDRKVNSGAGMLGLRTLELSEVQSADAETYRPRDGGRNMRQ